MNNEVPYMPSVTNLHKILDAIQRAACPEYFSIDFLKDLGFTSSNDRSALKMLKFLGLLDATGRPQSSYRDFMDGGKAKRVLAERLREAYDDLFIADRQANDKQASVLKGWFKTKTGAGDAAAEKMATTFKSLTQYADFTDLRVVEPKSVKDAVVPPVEDEAPEIRSQAKEKMQRHEGQRGFGLVYRFEIHLPDTQNVDTFRAIFKALREELM